ncbi:MAG TPA: CarD family transcriptional regulator [Candidatus Binatia bacterium]|nr:CarD family transcriptional regulator [Candidatus Binatia bacterium]
MKFSIGNKVVYPSQGPCLIGAVENKVVAGRPTNFYRLTLLDDSGDAVFVPVEKVKALHIRQLMVRSTIPKLLSHLKNFIMPPKNWKQRAIDNAKLLASGSAFDLAEVVESLTELDDTKGLTPRDRQTLNKARKFLICEISEVMRESRNAAEREIDQALESKRTLLKSNTD